MLSSSELVSWDQEKGQWHTPEKEEGEGEEEEEGEEKEGWREGTARDLVCECSSTLSE